MDNEQVNYKQEVFDKIRDEIQPRLIKIGFKPWYENQIPFVPISAFLGTNIVDLDPKTNT